MALVGLSAESMVRDPGYLMSDIGRRLERARLLVRILLETLVPVPDADIAGLTHETLLACCESLVAYRRRYRSDIEVDALSSLLITDPSNPRSLAFQADRLMADLRRLPGAPPREHYSRWAACSSGCWWPTSAGSWLRPGAGGWGCGPGCRPSAPTSSRWPRR